jgi:hypothetical protein
MEGRAFHANGRPWRAVARSWSSTSTEPWWTAPPSWWSTRPGILTWFDPDKPGACDTALHRLHRAAFAGDERKRPR